MDLERFECIVDAYGGDAAAWPAGERAAALALLAAEPGARALREAARALDRELATYTVAPPPPLQRVLAARPRPSGPERFLGWLVPAAPLQLWRPALAAMLPLALGLVIGVGPLSRPAESSWNASWEQQERHLLAAATGETP